ncbi:MAG: cupin domain-containing protein [Promethearchaeota archaeon]
MELAAVKNLENLIDYQENSVVSKTLIDKNVGTVTIFAFDKGEGLSEHKAPYDALVYIFDGEAEISIKEKLFRLKKDQMIIMPANQPHALRAIEKYKMMLIMIKSE